MARAARIRFAGDSASLFLLALGPIDLADAPEREFHGGQEIEVGLADREDRPDCVDVTFADGEYALCVPKEFFIELYGSSIGAG